MINGNLSVRKRFNSDELSILSNLSVRRRGPTDKICPIGKLLSGLTFHLSVLMRVVLSVSAVTSCPPLCQTSGIISRRRPFGVIAILRHSRSCHYAEAWHHYLKSRCQKRKTSLRRDWSYIVNQLCTRNSSGILL